MNLIDHVQGKSPWGTKRSGKWPKVRTTHLKENPRCALCDGTKKINVHHKIPFHMGPALELDPANLITLCEGGKNVNCHLVMGHLLNFRSHNPTVDRDVVVWAAKILNRPSPK